MLADDVDDKKGFSETNGKIGHNAHHCEHSCNNIHFILETTMSDIGTRGETNVRIHKQ